MFKQQKKHSIDVLFVIVLFCVFSLSVISLTGTGAKVYQNIVDNMSLNHSLRTSSAYVVNKIRQADSEGNVSIGTYAGCDALILTEEIYNITYCTYLYYYNGKLKELFTRQGQVFDPACGTDIIEAESFKMIKMSDSLFRFDIQVTDAESQTLFVHLHSN